jgi:hypothetical protein
MRYAYKGSVYSILLFLGVLFAASCGGTDNETGSGGSGSGGSGSGGSGSGGEDSPCVDNEDCTKGFNLICAATDDGACGPTTRKCIEYPPSCGEGTFSTVCGCDGKSHAVSPCPSDLSFQIDPRPGSCPAAAGMSWCGDGACSIGTQYCVEGNTSIECVALPADCMAAQATCACLEAANMTACGCVDEPGGGIRVNGCGL